MTSPRASKPDRHTPAVQGLPRAARGCFPELMAGELVPASWLRADVDRHLAAVREAAARREFVDVALAQRIADHLAAMLDALEHETPEGHRRVVYAAARYFVRVDDGDHDIESEIGFHDDAEVLNAVARYLQRHDLVIELP